MGTLAWLLVVAVGIALGFSVGKFWPGGTRRITSLEEELATARSALHTYRQDVSTHFERTAELFDKVTADYRGLYDHLALSARQLGAIRGEAVELPLAEPGRLRLGSLDAPAKEQPQEAADPPAEAPAAVPATAESGAEAAATEVKETTVPQVPPASVPEELDVPPKAAQH
jgi:uncharacterized protein